MLTERETEVARLAAEGLYSKQIADRLGTSIHTVKNQFTSIYRKVGANNRAQALTVLMRQGIIE